MGKPRPAPAAALVVIAFLAASCGGSSPSAGHSPVVTASSSAAGTPPATGSTSPSSSPAPTTPSPSPSPAAVSSPYGVLVSPPSAGSYTVSLIAPNGHVAASAQASAPASPTCANAAAGVVPPPISTSNSRVYFMDGQGVIRFLAPNGDTGRATSVPAPTGSRRATFAISPDDQRVAVVVIDFTSSGASTRLYLEDLNGGGNHIDSFSQSGAYTLWPTGWHGTNNLVLAKVPSCTQGGGFGCCGPQELHVVDPVTAARRFTIGGAGCVISGPATPAGASCETSTSSARVFSWTAVLLRTYPIPGPGMGPIYLSPDGRHLALSTNPNQTTVEGYSTLNMLACGWIDDTHIIAGGDTQTQARVGDVTNGTIVPVAAQGDCAGRLPGGL